MTQTIPGIVAPKACTQSPLWFLSEEYQVSYLFVVRIFG